MTQSAAEVFAKTKTVVPGDIVTTPWSEPAELYTNRPNGEAGVIVDTLDTHETALVVATEEGLRTYSAGALVLKGDRLGWTFRHRLVRVP